MKKFLCSVIASALLVSGGTTFAASVGSEVETVSTAPVTQSNLLGMTDEEYEEFLKNHAERQRMYEQERKFQENQKKPSQPAEPMDPERRKWLDDFIKQLDEEFENEDFGN